MLTKQTAIKKVKQFLSECQQLSFTIDKAILFGSVMQAEVTEYSDIDLALFSKKFSNNILKNIDLLGSVNIRYPDIDVHAYPSSQYKQKGLLMDQIKKTGIEIPLKWKK